MFYWHFRDLPEAYPVASANIEKGGLDFGPNNSTYTYFKQTLLLPIAIAYISTTIMAIYEMHVLDLNVLVS